nr:reverse transcriptase domain-containing protein [Tanacetum cinerariifolium]
MFMGNETGSKIEGKGKVILKLTSGKDLVLSNVLHVPNITKNLISSPILSNKGFKLVFKSDNFVITKGAKNNVAYRFLVYKFNIEDISNNTIIESAEAKFFKNIFPYKDKEKQISNPKKRVVDNKLSQEQTDNNFEVPQENVEPRRNDMLIMGTNMDVINQTKKMLHSSFDMKDMGEGDVILVLEGYCDANWISNHNEGKSISGHVFTLEGAVVSWKSSKQTVNTRSTMEAEFVALDKDVEEDEWLRSFIEAEKVHKEKARHDKLKEVKAHLNFEGCSGRNSKIQEVSQHSKSRTPNGKGRREGGVFSRLGGKGESVFAHSKSCYQSSHSKRTEFVPIKCHHEGMSLRKTKVLSKSEDSEMGHWKSRLTKKKSRFKEADLHDHGYVKKRIISHLTIDFFQAAAKVERWLIPTRCHMFNFTLTGSARVWFDDLPSESMDSYDDLKKAFLSNILQQKKCIEDSVEIHHIKQRERESMEDFLQSFKTESRHVKGASECMRISEFMHRITNLELIKRLHDKILKSMDEMMRTNRRTDQSWKVVACNQGAKTRQWKEPTKSGKKGRRVRKGQSYGNFNGPTMEKGGQAKDYIKRNTHTTKQQDYPTRVHDGLRTRSTTFDVTQTAKERIKVAIHSEYPKKTIEIGSTLTKEGRKELCDFLRRNLDIFAWKPADMTGVPRHIAKHRLNVQEGCSPNAWATYQRLVDKAFQKQIGRNLEVYMDNLVIKSHTEQEIIRDIEETFKTLMEINMKLNPKKCTFGMEEDMFMGYKVNTKGIKVCPDKVESVLGLPSPKCLKDVQRLNGKLASLNRFLAKSAKKSLPFFKTLKKCTVKIDFQWIAEAEAAFRQMKKLIVELPTLTTLMEKEELIVYLVAAKEAMSVVLMTEREAKQMPIYFVSRGLQDFIAERSEDDSLGTSMEVEEELLDPWTLLDSRSQNHRANGCKKPSNKRGLPFSANQVNGSYIAKESGMIKYLEKVKTLISGFRKFSIKQVPISENKKADALSKIASTSFARLTKQVLVEELKEKSINEIEVLIVMEEEGNTWMTPIYEYLVEETPLRKEKRQGRYGTIQDNMP